MLPSFQADHSLREDWYINIFEKFKTRATEDILLLSTVGVPVEGITYIFVGLKKDKKMTYILCLGQRNSLVKAQRHKRTSLKLNNLPVKKISGNSIESYKNSQIK